jgi:hypothetical protein
VIAKGGTEMILAAALRAVPGQLSAGHRHERTGGPSDGFQVTDDERVVERDRAKCLKSFSRFVHEFHTDLGDFHGCSPCDSGGSTATSDGRYADQTVCLYLLHPRLVTRELGTAFNRGKGSSL